MKTIKLNADYGSNVRGDVCSFDDATADRLIASRLKTPGGEIPGAVFMTAETKSNLEFEANFKKSKADEENLIRATAATMTAAGARGR